MSSDSLYTKLVSKGLVGPLWLDTIASTVSIMKHVSLSAGCLLASKTFKLTSSCTLNFNSPRYTSIIVLPVVRKGLLNIMGISLSSSMSRTMKSVGKINLYLYQNVHYHCPPPPPPPTPPSPPRDVSVTYLLTGV